MRCIVYRTGALERCSAEGTVFVRSGCKHEHFGDYWVCEVCARLGDQGKRWCGECYAADGHVCIVAFKRLPVPRSASL